MMQEAHNAEERQAMKLAAPWHYPYIPEGRLIHEKSFMSDAELDALGIEHGEGCQVSKFARFYCTRLKLGDHVRIDDFAVLTGEIEIGSHVQIPPFCGLYGRYGIRMEDFSGLCPGCLLFSESDDYSGNSLLGGTIPDEYKTSTKGPVHLGRHVVLGVHATVLGGVTIGEGVIVGAFSLVKKPIEDKWAFWGGVPAKRLKDRPSGLLELERQLRQSE